MDDLVEPMLLEEFQDARAVPDVEAVVREVSRGVLEAIQVPGRVALRPEEIRAHVVVHAMHAPAQRVKMFDHFRTDKSVGASDEYGFHSEN